MNKETLQESVFTDLDQLDQVGAKGVAVLLQETLSTVITESERIRTME